MKNDIYRLVTVNDGASDNAAILKVFSEIASGRLKNDFMLLNYYDDVPVSHSSTIAAIDGDSVELKVHEHQALILKHDNGTLIKSRYFHRDLGVHCYASHVNIAQKVAVLHNFAYAQIREERREAVRVKAKDRLPLKFTYDDVTIEGNLLDISGCSVSICFSHVPAINSDQGGLLSFTLAETLLRVAGSFVRATYDESERHICVFRIKPDRMTGNIIGRFIYQRQAEIIQQLRERMVVEQTRTGAP